MMASAIDSGVDMGNDSNDSSVQEKIFKMDSEHGVWKPNLITGPGKDATTQTSQDQSQPQSSNKMTKDNPIKRMSDIPCPKFASPGILKYKNPIPGLNVKVENYSERNEVNTASGSVSSKYENQPLLTKLRGFQLRCIKDVSRIRYERVPDEAQITLIQQRRQKEYTALWEAVCFNNCDNVRRVLEAGVSPNFCKIGRKRTCLHVAASMGFTNVVKLLLSYGANPNAKDSNGNTPLHLAACTYHVNIVTLLLQAGTRVNELDRTGHSPLQLAITKFNLMKRSIIPHPELKEQVCQVIAMLTEYMKRKEGTEVMDPELLNKLESLVLTSNSNEQVENNIQDLLSNLSSLKVSGPL